MNKQELKDQARRLAANRLLPMVLEQRRNTLIETWQRTPTVEKREELWHALRQLDELAGAIDNAIREHGGNRTNPER